MEHTNGTIRSSTRYWIIHMRVCVEEEWVDGDSCFLWIIINVKGTFNVKSILISNL